MPEQDKLIFPAASALIALAIIISYIAFSTLLVFPNPDTLRSLSLSSESPQNILFYIFVHSGYSHLIANLCMILFAGLILEPILGRKQILIIFIGGAIFSGLGFILLNSDNAIIGASGGGVALLTAAFIANPQKALIYVAIALVLSFALTQGISFAMTAYKENSLKEIAKLETQKTDAIKTNNTGKAQIAQTQIEEKTGQINTIENGISGNGIYPNFELHAFAAVFAALYMLIFHKEVIARTARTLN